MLNDAKRAAFEAVIIIGIISSLSFVQAAGPDANGICRSVLVRNRISNLVGRLRGCKIIEGSLQIALIEQSPQEEFIGISFPELKEITHYLAVYRVHGLINIGSLLPNLTIIRGTRLIANAALAIHDNPDLEEIGLYGLTHIQEGSIMIQKNPKLCFAESINWDAIQKPNNTETYYDIVKQQNRDVQECRELEMEQCQGCPGGHCWSEGRCQILNMDCHPLCAGGCSEPNNPEACISCKGVLYQNKCIESCPPGTLDFMRRLCISEEECLDRKLYLRRTGWFLYVVFNGTCIIDCPSRYKLDEERKGCIPCNGTCYNVCTPTAEDNEIGVYRLTSISETKILASCTHINGSLALVGLSNTYFSGVQRVLDDNLGMIEEIRGQLKIMHSHGLTSLNFLSGLRVIKGDLKLEPQRIGNDDEFVPHTIAIKHNNNLQSLWDWDRVNREGGLRILNGSILFQENPKLCLAEINEMIKQTNMTSFVDKTDVSPESNGNQAFCNSSPFNVTVEERTPYKVVVALHKAAITSRYLIYYRRSTGKLNLTEIHVSLTQCGDGEYEWKVTEDAEMSPTSSVYYFVLEPLQPAVDYVYFVRSLNSSMATSFVYNVTTLPAQPSPPLNFHLNDSTDSSITLNWNPPYYPHGTIKYYFIRGYYQTDQLADFLERDYCKDKLKNEPWAKTGVRTTTPPPNSTQISTLAPNNSTRTSTLAPNTRTKSSNSNSNDVSIITIESTAPNSTRTPTLAPSTKSSHPNSTQTSTSAPNTTSSDPNSNNVSIITVESTAKNSTQTSILAPNSAETSDLEPISTQMSAPDSIRAIVDPNSTLLLSALGINTTNLNLSSADIQFILQSTILKSKMIPKRKKVAPKVKAGDDCIPCMSLLRNLKEPKNVTDTQASAKIETKVERCNKYEQEGHLSLLSKAEPGLEQCDAYIYRLVETRSQMLIAARTGVRVEHPPAPNIDDDTHPEEWKKGSDGRYEAFSFAVDANANMTTTIDNLRQFGLYVVTIKACPDPETGVSCSRESIVTTRTKPSKNADHLNQTSVTVKTINQTAFVSWEEPSFVNSFVHSYILSYRSREVENMEFQDICVTAKHFRQLNRTYLLPNLPSEEYELRLRAVSLSGEGPYIATYFTIESLVQHFISPATIIVIVGVLIVAAISLIFLFLRYSNPKQVLYASVNPKYIPIFGDQWEVERENLTLMKQLGRGIFGSVHEGILQPGDIRCAVKTTTSVSEEDNVTFLKEATIMKEFSKAFHIVKLLGVVTKGSPVYVIMELMEEGDLKTFLLRSGSQLCDEENTLPDAMVLKMAAQIADGMSFLESKKFVHRDLAARNCMAAADGTIKIGDFGLARDIYETDYYRKGDKATLPIRWMAPESIRDGVFTCSSDVWSYGVVLWEITTLAQMPYHPKTNEEVIKHVQTGNLLEIPPNTNEVLRPLMRHCWQWHPSQRPRFLQILKILDSYVDSDFRKVSYFHNGEDPNDSSEVPPFTKTASEDCYIYNDENDEINLYLGQTPSVSNASTSSVKYTRMIPENRSE